MTRSTTIPPIQFPTARRSLQMRRSLQTLVTALLCVALAGCANLELAREEAKATNLRTARHWKTIANDVAGKLVGALGTERRPYVIRPPESRSAFADNLRTLLSSALVAKHAEVVADDAALPPALPRPWIVELQTAVIPHGPAGGDSGETLPPGSFTLLGGGVYLATRALGLSGAALADPVTAVGGGLLADAASLVPPKRPSTELLLTTSVAQEGRYRYRHSDVYFIDDDDFAQYVPSDADGAAGGGGQIDGAGGLMTVLYDPMHETASDALARADRHCARTGGRAVVSQRTRAASRDHDASFRCVYW